MVVGGAGTQVVAQPKRMRCTFWHAPARVIRQARQHIIRIIHGWPTTNDIITAHQRLTTRIIGPAATDQPRQAPATRRP